MPFYALMLSAAVIFVGCAAVKPAGEYTFEKITLKTGETAVVSLPSNPTTGYSWKLMPLPENSCVSAALTGYAADSKLIGSPGKETWEIKARKKGKAKLSFVYKRSWEKEILRKKEYKIYVK